MEQEESPSGFGGGDATGYSFKLVGAGNAPLPARGVLAYPPGSFWTRRTEGNSYVHRTRVSVTSTHGVLVKRYQSSSEVEKGKDGQVYSETLLEHLALLAHELRAQVPPDAKPGPTLTVGPQPVETIKLSFKIQPRGVGLKGGTDTQKIVLAAAPEKLLDAPLPIRFGELESVTNTPHGTYVERIVEWKGAR